MTCIVNKKNIKSLSMIASFAKNANVKQFRDDLFGGRCRFEYDLSNVNIEKPGKKDEETLWQNFREFIKKRGKIRVFC